MNIKPKKLTLQEMWSLYLMLKDSMSDKEFLIDEVDDMLDKMAPDVFIKSLVIMYPKYDATKFLPVEHLTNFIAGLKSSRLFEFVKFIEAIRGRS